MLGSQVVVWHCGSPEVSHWTMDPASTAQVSSAQTSVPLHRSASSKGAQSELAVQAQASVAVPAQTPSAQTSSSVQVLPSSQTAPETGALTQPPAFSSQ